MKFNADESGILVVRVAYPSGQEAWHYEFESYGAESGTAERPRGCVHVTDAFSKGSYQYLNGLLTGG